MPTTGEGMTSSLNRGLRSAGPPALMNDYPHPTESE